jgi:hypothetical protein
LPGGIQDYRVVVLIDPLEDPRVPHASILINDNLHDHGAGERGACEDRRHVTQDAWAGDLSFELERLRLRVGEGAFPFSLQISIRSRSE